MGPVQCVVKSLSRFCIGPTRQRATTPSANRASGGSGEINLPVQYAGKGICLAFDTAAYRAASQDLGLFL